MDGRMVSRVKPSANRWGWARSLLGMTVAALAGGVGAPGCVDFDPTPTPRARGTLGEEVFQVFCERMAAEADPRDVSGRRWKPVCSGRRAPADHAPPRLVALYENRDRLVDALDRMLPETLDDDLSIFLGQLVPLFDEPEERLPRQTRRLAELLSELASDDEALDALERLGHRQGYRPLRLALGILRPALSYPELDEFVGLALRTLATDGSAGAELTALQAALALEMATYEASTEPPEQRTLVVARDLLLRDDARFGGPTPHFVLSRDHRGLALPRLPSTTALPPPFIDRDRDGLADIDDRGRFVGADGSPLALPAPFRILNESGVPRDANGRALRSDGTRYYEYFDAQRTLLAGVTAELAPFFDPDAPVLLDGARGLEPLLGSTRTDAARYGRHTLGYQGFDTRRGPLFDAVHALGELLRHRETYDALLVTERLLEEHEGETAGVIRAARFMALQGDLHPEARLTEPNNLWDDVIDLAAAKSRRPGMLEAVMRSFGDPRSAELGEVYADLMRHRDRVTYDPRRPGGPPIGLPLSEPVNRRQADTFENESLFQRTLALIDGLNGVDVCNKAGARLDLTVRILGIDVNLRWPLVGSYDECELLRIENVAEAYALAILGEYELELQSGFLNFMISVAGTLGISVDEALELSSGIPGLTRRPTPEALNRLVFWGLDDNESGARCAEDYRGCNSPFVGQLFAPVEDRHGNDVIERHPGTIFAWEMPGFYEGMRPLLEVLHRPAYRVDDQGRYVFGALLSTLHEHWASPGHELTQSGSPLLPNFSHQSNGRSYEPLLAEGFGDARLIRRLHELVLALEAVELDDGRDGVRVLAEASEVMLDSSRHPDLRTRGGDTHVSVNDGSRTLRVSPLYVLLDAFSRMDDALDASPERRRAWRRARRGIADRFLGTRTLGASFRLENPRARPILLAILPFVRERIDAHEGEGDLDAWATTLDDRLADTLGGPFVAAIIRLLDAVQEDPEAREALSRFVGYLVDEASSNDAFLSTLHGLADLLMILDDGTNIVPLFGALSEGLAPNVREVVAEGGTLDTEGSAVRDALDLVREVHDLDRRQTLITILGNAVALPESGEETTPLETILDVIAEVNRAEPNSRRSLDADDWREVLDHTVDFISDEDRGLERLYRVVQHRRCAPEHEQPCADAGARIESRGLCEPHECVCTESGGELTWSCAP